jgi:hypothetical protein
MGYKKIDCQELVAQLRSYILQDHPYNAPYLPGSDTPLKWWNTCFTNSTQLQNLAIQLFSITPNAASCERVWSTVGWIYGNRRTRLNLDTIEALTKVYRFYMTNVKQELHYHILEEDTDEIIQMVEDSLMESYEEELDSDDEIQVLSSLNEPVIFDHVEVVEELNIVSEFNLEPLVVIDYVDVSHFERNYNVSDDNGDEEFNVEDLVKDILC